MACQPNLLASPGLAVLARADPVVWVDDSSIVGNGNQKSRDESGKSRNQEN